MDAAIIPIVAISIPIVVAPIAIICNTARKMREMEHAERLRALELGRTLPKDEPWWSPARIAVTIGGGVPVASLLTAFFATESMGSHRAEPIQIIAGLVSVTSVLTGGMLASRHISLHHQNRAPVQTASYTKPAYDPDAYDVVGTRGR